MKTEVSYARAHFKMKQPRWKRLALAAIALLTGALTFARPYRLVEPLPQGIVDMHCHIAGIGAGGSGCFVSDKLRRNWRFRVYLKSFGVTRREVEEHGDRLIAERISKSLADSQLVSKAVILAMDGVIGRDGQLDANRTEVYVPNEFVAEASALTQVQKPGSLKEAVTRPEFAERLFYGSDFPLINTLLASPWYHCWQLGIRRAYSISCTRNCWDRDVMTMQYLGTPADVFAKSKELAHEVGKGRSNKSLATGK